MYGDTSTIRRLARNLREQGVDIRAEALALHGCIESTAWTGKAAAAMRAAATDRLSGLRHAATLHDDAAAALDHHADEVDRLKELIATVERRAHRILGAARERLADLADKLLAGFRSIVPDPLDELIAEFVPPPPGHKDWLDVDLPGLGN